jgi:hypothetical protein
MNNPIPFDLTLARQLAEFSQRAYQPDAANDGEAVYEAVTDTKALVAELAEVGNFVVVAFRGTADIRNWLTDVEFAKAPIASGVRVHHGFLKSAEAILPLLQVKLGHPADSKPLIITGHSLGGALASLAAYKLQQAGYPIESVYTFASPRVGNAGWRDAYHQLINGPCGSHLGNKSFRVAAVGDLVPLIPGIFTTFRDGYRHVGVEVLLNGDGLLLEPGHYLELFQDGLAAYVACRRADWDFILARHAIAGNYLASLDAIIGATAQCVTEFRKG